MGLLRTLLALAVVFSHTPRPYVFVGGPLAVQMFYMISGFLISYVLVNTPAYRSPTVFWFNRALRLYPVYYVVAVLTLLCYAIVNPAYWADLARVSAALKAYVAIVNVTLVGQDWAFFLAMHEDAAPLPDLLLVKQAWTLGVELSFYLIAPFIVHRPQLMLTLFVTSLAARLMAMAEGFGFDQPWDYRFFPFELALFIAGMASHQLLLGRVRAMVAAPSHRHWPLVALAAIMLLGFSYFALPLPDAIRKPLLLAALFAALPFLFVYQSKNAWDRRVGDLSYPIYIGHLLVLLGLAYVVKLVPFIDPLSWPRALLGVAASLGFAWVLKTAVADPVERWRARIRQSDASLPDPAPKVAPNSR